MHVVAEIRKECQFVPLLLAADVLELNICFKKFQQVN